MYCDASIGNLWEPFLFPFLVMIIIADYHQPAAVALAATAAVVIQVERARSGGRREGSRNCCFKCFAQENAVGLFFLFLFWEPFISVSRLPPLFADLGPAVQRQTAAPSSRSFPQVTARGLHSCLVQVPSPHLSLSLFLSFSLSFFLSFFLFFFLSFFPRPSPIR